MHNEKIALKTDDWSRITRLKKLQKRIEREEKRAEENHRHFLIGALVAKHFKEVLEIPVHKGKDAKAKNPASFAPLERFLALLAADKGLLERLKSAADDALEIASEDG